MKFSTKISLLVAGIFLITFALMAYLGYSSTTMMLGQLISENLESRAAHSMDKIDRMFSERFADLKMISTDRVLSSRSSTPAQITARLREYQRSYPIYSSLSFFNLDRMRIADTDGRSLVKQQSLAEYWPEIAAGKDFVTAVSGSTATHGAVIYFAAKVRSGNGAPLGVVAARLPIDSVSAIAEQAITLNVERSTLVELLDRDGLILYSNYNPKGMLKERSKDWGVLQGLLRSGKNAGSARHVFSGEDEITAFAREQGSGTYRGKGWVLVMCVPVDVAFADASRQGRQFGILFGVIGLLVLSVTFLASRAAVKPLHELSLAAAKIGKGDLDAAVKVRSDDEIGQLAAAFNAMALSLKESENRFRDLVELLPQVVYEADLTGKVTFANRHALKLFGYTQEELAAGLNVTMVVAPEDRARLSENMARMSKGEKLDNLEYTAMRKDGSTFPFLTFIVPIFHDKRVAGMRGIGVDITERKHMEDGLRQRERQLAEAGQAAHLGSWVWKAGENEAYWTDELFRILGVQAQEREPSLETFLKFVHPGDREIMDRTVQDAMLKGMPTNVELRIVRPDGEVRFVNSRTRATLDAAGRPATLLGVVQDITERKRVEQDLQKFKMLIENTSDFVGIATLDGKALYLNGAGRALVGLGPEDDIRGRSVLDFYANEAAPDQGAHIREALERSGNWRGETLLRNFQTNEAIPAEVNRFVIKDADTAIALAVVNRDITNRKEAEKDLRESEEKLRTITSTARDAIVMMGSDGKVSFWNPAAEKIFGYTGREILGKEIHSTLAPARYQEAFEKGFSRFRQTGEGAAIGKTLELDAVKKNGEEFKIEISLAAIQIKGAWQAVGVIRDITERKQAEQELQKFKMLIENSMDFIGIAALDGSLLYVNKAGRMLVGLSEQDVATKKILDFYREEGSKEQQAMIAETMSNSDFWHGEARMRHFETNKMVPVEMSGFVIKEPETGRPIALANVSRDITDRKKMEEALRRSEEMYRSVVDNIGIGIALISPNMEILALNNQMKAWSPAIDPAQKPLCYRSFNRPPRDTICSYCPTVKTLREGRVCEAVTETPVETGIVNYRVISSPIKDSQGGVIAAIELVEDITVRKRAEDEIRKLNEMLELKVEERTRQLLDAQEELIRKEKLSTLGRIAGSVGHELRNPLGVMNNAVYFLQTVLVGADDTVKEYLGIIKSEIFGAEQIVSDLLDAVRTKPPRPQALPARDLVQTSLEKCRVRENIKIDLQLPTELRILADALQMRQVFINLINNAVDAMPDGGVLRISAKQVSSFESQVPGSKPETRNTEPETSFIEISVSDTGCGISPENMRKLFQPLYTTKTRGIGLGLVVVKNLIEANGGKISVESEVGKGTSFTILLPSGGG